MTTISTAAPESTPARTPVATSVMLALAEIGESTTNPRQDFDKAKLKELADSITVHGVLQPILVRINPGSESGKYYELVAGARRFRASKLAGMKEIPAIVRELGDKDVLEIQVIENLQRADLHPLEEAEGYEKLIANHGYDVPGLATKIGKSKEYVYTRMKLAALSPACRKLFYAGELSPSTAIVVARIPVHKLQDEAAKRIVGEKSNFGFGAPPMTAREAVKFVQEHYMLNISAGGFPASDTTLVPAAGPCGACPKRTGNQPELFGDVKGKDLCTDPVCFAAKREAFNARAITEAKAAGGRVIEGPQAKKLKPNSYGQIGGGFVELDRHCYEDKKNRTFRQLLGSKAEIEVVKFADPHSGKLVDVVEEASARKVLAARGVKLQKSDDDSMKRHNAEQKRKEQQARTECDVRAAILDAVGAVYKQPSHEDALLIAQRFYEFTGFDNQKLIARRWGYGDVFDKDRDAPIKKLSALTPVELARFMLETALIGETRVNTWSMGRDNAENLNAVAKRLRVDVDKIRKAITDAAKAKAKAKAKKAAPKSDAKPEPKPKPKPKRAQAADAKPKAKVAKKKPAKSKSADVTGGVKQRLEKRIATRAGAAVEGVNTLLVDTASNAVDAGLSPEGVQAELDRIAREVNGPERPEDQAHDEGQTLH
jgi:ParB/RepB/Spo0J family partition protein